MALLEHSFMKPEVLDAMIFSLLFCFVTNTETMWNFDKLDFLSVRPSVAGSIYLNILAF